MERFIKGEVVVIPFPFSDLSETKRRPALIISVISEQELILCQITSKLNKDAYAISLQDEDFKSGNLKKISNIRPNHIFTADRSIILYKIGQLKKEKLDLIVESVIEIIKN